MRTTAQTLQDCTVKSHLSGCFPCLVRDFIGVCSDQLDELLTETKQAVKWSELGCGFQAWLAEAYLEKIIVSSCWLVWATDELNMTTYR